MDVEQWEAWEECQDSRDDWKSRALAAEARVKELEGQLATLERLASKVVGAIY